MALRSARKGEANEFDFHLGVGNTCRERSVVGIVESISIPQSFELSTDDASARLADHTARNRIFQIQTNEQIHVARRSERTDLSLKILVARSHL